MGCITCEKKEHQGKDTDKQGRERRDRDPQAHSSRADTHS
jgi:hypothetical protein